jgi:hypothetical protein
VANYNAVYLRQAETWKKLVWPEKIMLRWVVSDLGLFAAPKDGQPRVVISSVVGSQAPIESDPVMGQDLRKLVIDDAGRIWVGTDQAFAVLDRRGHLLAQWPAGTLDGLTGSILDMVVVGAGPKALPASNAARTWNVKGQFVTYKSHSPLSGAALALCSPGASDCVGDSSAKRTTTDARGSFQFAAIPNGEFWIRVKPPAGIQDCESPFTVNDKSLVPARDCHELPGTPGVCDLGTITTCFPFEMPPSH